MSIRYLSGINVDANTLFVDSANDRVGIGTSNPTTTLHLDATGGANIRLQRTSASSNRFDMGTDGTNMEFNVRDTGAFTFGGGNVGIGTTAPSHKLHVASSTTYGTVARVLKLDQANSGGDVNQPTYYGSILLSGNGYNWGAIDTIQTNPNASWASRMAFSTMPGGGDYNLYERMSITSAGNVGIGTTSPDSKLRIQNDNATVPSLFIRDGGTPTADHIRVSSGTYGDAFFVKATGNVGIGTSSPDSYYATNLVVASGSEGGVTIAGNSSGENYFMFADGTNGADRYRGYIGYNHGSNYMRFGTDGNERMRITSSGNVGIGNTAPTAMLDVNGSIRVTGRTTPTTGNGLELFYYSPSDCFYIEAYNYSTSAYKAIRYAGASHQFLTGNVGIGTTSPAQKLSVYGNIYQRTGDYITWSNGDAQIGAVSGYNLAFSTYNGVSALVERMRITSAGNVGIGTTSPNKQLTFAHVNDDAIQIRRLTTGEGTTSLGTGISWTWSSSGSDNQTWAAIRVIMPGSGNSNMTFSTTPTGGAANLSERMRIADNGNVGIGTTSPASALHVIGEISVPSTIRLTDAGVNNAYISESWGINLNGVATHPIQVRGGSFSVGYTLGGGATYGTNNMFVAGNVGIGTTAPASKLQVSGDSVQGQGLLNISNTKSAGGSGFPAARFRNVNGNHSYGVVAEFVVGTTVGADRPSTLYYSDLEAKSWQVGMTTAASGWGNSNGDFAIGYRASNTPTSFTTWPTAYLTITSGGNVGIGTTSPSSLLHINGANNTAPLRIQAGNNANYYFSGNSTSGYAVDFLIDNTAFYIGHNSASRDFVLRTNSTDRVTIKGGGNVGIGTTSPSTEANLSLGAMSASEGGQLVLNSGAAYSLATHIDNYINSFRIMYGSDSSSLSVQFIIDHASGHVGIGTTSPGALLHVAGQPRFDSTGGQPFTTTSPVTQDKYAGYNSFVLTDPDTWLKISINGTDYVIPAYAG